MGAWHLRRLWWYGSGGRVYRYDRVLARFGHYNRALIARGLPPVTFRNYRIGVRRRLVRLR